MPPISNCGGKAKSRLWLLYDRIWIGIDYAHVRHVICFGLPYSVEDFAQMMGRTGHDGEPVVALTLFDRNAEVARSHQLNTTALGDMLHFATMQQICRWRWHTK